MIILKDETMEACVGGLTLYTGFNSGNVKAHDAPDAAVPGALNAFTQVVTKGPGEIANVEVGP